VSKIEGCGKASWFQSLNVGVDVGKQLIRKKCLPGDFFSGGHPAGSAFPPGNEFQVTDGGKFAFSQPTIYAGSLIYGQPAHIFGHATKTQEFPQ
jgi:hypothetical protein